MEAHPYAAVGYLSALDVHGLTREQPKRITAIVSKTAPAEETPIGTEPRDWQGIDRVAGRRVSSVSGIPVHWRQLAPERYFGAGIYQPYGFSLRATTPERTLLDVLQDPELGGGFENVLEAWSRAIDTFDLDLLIAYVERFDIGVLRQRVGFLLEELGISHPMLDRWRAGAQRGGSSKLVAANAYAPTYSERWNLSINAPIGVLSSIT
jgi:predicted transcriptional regulator of viral defense system